MLDLDRAFADCFDSLAAIGRDPAGGWSRFAWTPQDAAARAWFRAQAQRRGLSVDADRAGNLWAWWDGSPGAAGSGVASGVASGSHLDTVPRGGAYDGALGVVSALLAVDLLREQGHPPTRPLGVVAFADEEGARFNTPTFGSRVLSGQLDPATVLGRVDASGTTLQAALHAAGVPDLGPDPERLARVGCFVELHVEQGRGLADPDANPDADWAGRDAPVAVGSGIWPHGRWRVDLVGEANHAGTTRMADRRDPTAALAALIDAARSQAEEYDAVATVGRVVIEPGGTNAVPGRVTAWLDARAADEPTLEQLVEAVETEVLEVAERHEIEAAFVEESFSAAVEFDPDLAERVADAVAGAGFPRVILPTAAGHDAGTLAAVLPTAMLFVRNPTGVSHSPAEGASVADCVAGVRALAAVLAELTR